MSTPGNHPPHDPWGAPTGASGPPQASVPPAGWESQPTQVPPPYGQPDQYGPPAYGQPQYGQPANGQPQYGQPAYGQPQYGQPAYGQPQYGQPVPPPYGAPGSGGPGKGRRFGIIGLIVVIVVGLLAGGYFVFLKKDSAAALSYNGKKINQPAGVLTAGEADLAAIIKARHGAAAATTRCYFAVPKTPAAGATKSDIDPALRCGPVLFVDGDASQSYLSLALTAGAASNDGVTLTPATAAQSLDPQQVPGTLTLERPDKAAPPAGSGGLTVPAPPPAAADFLGSVSLGNSSVPAAPANAVIGSKNGGVRLATLGPIPRYGAGDDARSAPTGQKLIAFSVANAPTTSGKASTTAAVVLHVVVGSSAPRLVSAGGGAPIVLAVPTTATDASLQLTDAGITQSISLLTGQPAPTNILVGQRANHAQTISRNLPLNWHWVGPSDTINRPSRLQVNDATLSYWGLTTSSTSKHPASTATAYLSVDMTYTYTGPPTGGFTSPGGLGPFGLDPAYLSLQLPSGAVIRGQDVSADPAFVYDVFEVPATFTTGTVILSGSTKNSNGLTFSVTPIVRIPVSIPAG